MTPALTLRERLALGLIRVGCTLYVIAFVGAGAVLVRMVWLELAK